MKLNYFTKRISAVGRLMATILCCVSAIAFFWQGAFLSNPVAMASPSASLIASDLGDQAKGAADDVRSGSKRLIRDTEAQVKRTANKNASKVDQADDNGGTAERKAMRDKARIEQRAETHASRTEKAVDDNMDAVKRTVDNIKGAFNK